MKSNNATYNRPEGDRFIDASYLVADIEENIKQLKEENAWEKNDRNGITIFKMEGVTVVLSCLHEETSINDITVEGTMVLQVIEGKINLTMEGDAFGLCEKKIAIIHPGIMHSIYALKTSSLLLTNYTGAASSY